MTTTISRRSRILAAAALALGTTAGAVAVLPGAAQAATPILKVQGANCVNGQWTIGWTLSNPEADPMTVTAASTTGAVTEGLTFTPNPIPAVHGSIADQSFPLGTTGTIDAHVTYNYPAQPAQILSASWTIGSTAGGVVINDQCSHPGQNLNANPRVVNPGGRTELDGECEPNTSGYVISDAFVKGPGHEFAGVGAAPFTTDSTGHFAVQATIDPNAHLGHYEVSARCGGGLLSITAPLDVVAPAVVKPAVVTTADPPVVVRPAFTG